MNLTNDRAILEKQKEQEFAKSCYAEFAETSVVKTNMRKTLGLSVGSYFPNLVSLITAGFGVFYILSSYEPHVRIVLGGLLVVVAAGLELAKRGLINVAARDYFYKNNLSPFLPLSIAVLILISMTVSFFGGNKLVHATAKAPKMEVNPEIAKIRQQIADKRKTIVGLRKTIWKGKITRDAVKGINANEAVINSLLARIDKLENQDLSSYAPIEKEFNAKIINFGYILGCIAVMADIALLFILWAIKKLKHDVLLLAQAKGFSSQLNKMDDAEQFITGVQDFINNGGQQKRNGSATNNTRPIGFKIPEPSERHASPEITDNNSDINNRDNLIQMRDDLQSVSNSKSVTQIKLDFNKEEFETYEQMHDPDRKRKTCVNCGEWFNYKLPIKKFCNSDCRIEYHHKMKRVNNGVE